MASRAKESYCAAAIFLEGPLHCASCQDSTYAWCNDGECLDLGYSFPTFDEAALKAKQLSATYIHDIIVTTSEDAPNSWVLVIAAPCMYQLVEATKSIFDHVNWPHHHIGKFSRISKIAPFDETFEYFKRISPQASLPQMIYPEAEFPFWAIAESNPDVLEDWERGDAA